MNVGLCLTRFGGLKLRQFWTKARIILNQFKMVCSHCILISQGWTGSSILWCQMKAHTFLIITPKFQLHIHYTLEAIAENVPISNLDFPRGGGLLKYDLGRDVLLRLEKKTHFYTKFCQKLRPIFIPGP